MKIENYVPDIVDDGRSNFFVKLLAPLTQCSICNNNMLYFRTHYYTKFERMYPAWYMVNLKTQLTKAGVRIPSDVSDKGGEFICVECAEAGLATFDCALCEEERASDLRQESYGIDPSEYLCSVCYGSVTAKEWAKKHHELRASHKYDWE